MLGLPLDKYRVLFTADYTETGELMCHFIAVLDTATGIVYEPEAEQCQKPGDKPNECTAIFKNDEDTLTVKFEVGRYDKTIYSFCFTLTHGNEVHRGLRSYDYGIDQMYNKNSSKRWAKLACDDILAKEFEVMRVLEGLTYDEQTGILKGLMERREREEQRRIFTPEPPIMIKMC